MGKLPKIKANNTISVIKQALIDKKKNSVKELEQDDCFKLSFKHIDRTQGQTATEWQNSGMLSEFFDTISNYCLRPLKEQQSTKFTIYGDFPPKNKTDFIYPNHVPEDAEWARIHINGLYCIAGHVVANTFYFVFFDANHKFYYSQLRNT
ncbi:hypothetical protein EON73_03605 [bacterium]|nr:MAG: hypothetical protein EON73_03605 [bacterium]